MVLLCLLVLTDGEVKGYSFCNIGSTTILMEEIGKYWLSNVDYCSNWKTFYVS